MITIPMTVQASAVTIPMDVSASSASFRMGVGAVYAMSTVDDYEGVYEYTPSEEMQTVEIEGLKATENIIINPIPSNYGLITWDGTTLTVS